MAAGGLKPACLPDKTVEAITTLMQPLYERDVSKKASTFQPIMYRSQVVAGVHYFIKVMVEEGDISKCVHLKVLRELDPQKFIFSLSGVQEDKTLDSTLEYF